MADDSTPRIWIGSLAAYNAGTLLGDWFDAIDATTDSREWIEKMVERRLGPVGTGPATAAKLDDLAQQHEEIWVFDLDNFGDFLTGECSPSDAQQIAQVMADLGDERDAFGAWCKSNSATPHTDLLDDFRDRYRGTWGNFRDYAEEMASDMLRLPEKPSPWDPAISWYAQIEFLAEHFDMDSYARDLEHGYTVLDAPDHNVFIFSD